MSGLPTWISNIPTTHQMAQCNTLPEITIRRPLWTVAILQVKSESSIRNSDAGISLCNWQISYWCFCMCHKFIH
jgi:hypothetical protein